MTDSTPGNAARLMALVALVVVALLSGCFHGAPRSHSALKPDVAGFLAAWHQKWPGVPSSADGPLLQKEREVCIESDASLIAQWRDAQQPDSAGLNGLIRFQLQTALHYLCPAREGLLDQGTAA